MKETAPLTMKDIARELGVSVATVSRALKDSPRISAERRAMIQQYAREHNFIPNVIAETLRYARVQPVKVIGVIIPDIVHYYFASVLAGIEQEAMSRGYMVIFAQSGESYDRERAICKSFFENKVCGIIVSQAKDTHQYDHFQRLLDAGLPLIFFDRICTGVNASRVVVDDYMGAFNAVSYLIERGSKRIAFYGSNMNMEISKNRFNGYKHDHEHDDDQHPHFYCEQCHETYCLDYAEMPYIALPEGFEATSANLMIKGTCPHCQKK